MQLADPLRRRLVVTCVIGGIYVALALGLAWGFPRGVTYASSIAAWLVVLPIWAVSYLALEFFWEKFLRLPIWARLHPVLRITLLVIFVVFVSLVFLAVASIWNEAGDAL
jgi:hypothetical protein